MNYHPPMPEQVIVCPTCRASIPLTEAISHQIRETTRKEMEGDFARRLAVERAQAAKDARAAAQQQITVELKDLQKQVEEKNRKLAEAQAQEMDLRRQRRDLEDRQKSLELDVARRLDQERKRIEDETVRRLRDEQHLKELEKEKQILDLRRQIEELKRMAEQGSQQTQGEVVELELEGILAATFPMDVIEPVAKGQRGADVLQRVRNRAGQACGTIIWESKHTKAFSDGWIQKLKDDQRAVKAEIAVLLTTALPKDVPHFGLYQGIWVTDHRCFASLATALRLSLVQVANARALVEGRHEKMEAVYHYLSGIEFKQRIEAVVETFIGMKDQLEQEKRAMTRIWSQREKQIERIASGIVGLHGDLKGIIGGSLPSIRSLELDPLPAPPPRPGSPVESI